MARPKLNLTPEQQERKEELRKQYKAAWMREYRRLHPDRILKAHIRYNQKVLDKLLTAAQGQKEEGAADE